MSPEYRIKKGGTEIKEGVWCGVVCVCVCVCAWGGEEEEEEQKKISIYQHLPLISFCYIPPQKAHLQHRAQQGLAVLHKTPPSNVYGDIERRAINRKVTCVE